MPKPLLKRDKMEVTCCRTAMTSLAESTNLAGETLRQADPTKPVAAAAPPDPRESSASKKMSVSVDGEDGCFVEDRAI